MSFARSEVGFYAFIKSGHSGSDRKLAGSDFRIDMPEN